jgi:hypothetical protein
MTHPRPLGSITKNLLEHLQTLGVDSSTRLEHHSSKVIVGTLEALIVASMLVQHSVILTRLLLIQMRSSKRANHCHIDSQTTMGSPALSPGRLRERSVTPRMPNFSSSGDNKPISAN